MMKLIVALSEEVKIRVISDGKESSTWYSNIQELAEAVSFARCRFGFCGVNLTEFVFLNYLSKQGVRVKLTPRTPDDMLHHKAGLSVGVVC